MGTSLTPEFWRLFAVLLMISVAVTFVMSAALDALVARLQQRRRPPADRKDRTSERPARIPAHH
ncbi:MAG: hypothetical protein HOV82_14090 [Streptomyces sp.]|nr:hypothetical protein [Streptomyces sp.]